MAMLTKFRKAERKQCKASIVIDGLSGKGKTGLALSIAYALSGDWNKVKAVDTENRSLDLYIGRKLHTGVLVESFDVGDITLDDGFKPSYFEGFRNLALSAGATSFIIDSFTHMWSYKGGVLDMVNDIQAKSLNKYTAWGDKQIVDEKAALMGLVRHPSLHCINTLRVKEKREVSTIDGKSTVVSLGDQEITMPDFKYEPDLVLTLESPGNSDGTAPVCTVTKSRYAPFKVDEKYLITAALLEQLRMFLEEGTSPEELFEMQRQDYIQAVIKHLDENPNARTLWKALKENNHVSDVELKDIPLHTIKQLYSQLFD